MYQIYLTMSVFVLLQLFLNISHFCAVNKKIFVQNNFHVLSVRIIKCYQFRNILSVWFGNGSQLLSDNDGANTHVACTKPKINQLSRMVLHGLGARQSSRMMRDSFPFVKSTSNLRYFSTLSCRQGMTKKL